MRQLGRDGRNRFGAAKQLRGAKRCVLEESVPTVPGVQEAPARSYGWAGKGLPLPATGGAYAVAFLEGDEIRVLAYLDPFGRVFATENPIALPPAREPTLTFAKDQNRSTANEEFGCVYVHDTGGTKREVARYCCVGRRYTLYDSWFDFGPYGSNLAYNDVLARAYLAFVHRPALGASPVPERGLAGVHARLQGGKALSAMRSIVADVRCAESDPVFRPPALVSCLAGWLAEAGLNELTNVKDEAVRLVRTIRSADTYYLGIEDEDAGISTETLWALEAALNRFLLVGEALGERATLATDVDCVRWDEYLYEAVALRHPTVGNLADVPVGEAGGEWSVRCALGATIERLRLPVRLDAALRCDVVSGAAAFDLTAPSGSLMPAWVWRDEAGWVRTTDEMRDAQARRYALHLGLVLAAAAFEASSAIERVDIVARPFVRVSFDRGIYDAFGRFEGARAGDLMPPYASSNARFDVLDAEACACLNDLPSSILRQQFPECADEELGCAARYALGADRCKDMRITFDAARRRLAEELADEIVCASSVTDAIRFVRAAQDDAAAKGDNRTVAACTRLMAALAADEIDMGDQNTVVMRFLGEDRCLVALGRARTLAVSDPDEAAQTLIDAVSEAAVLDGFMDGAATVYRAFDSYASRVLYNRARRGLGAPVRAAKDGDKNVEVLPDSFLFCHLEIAQLLEHSFDRTEEALRFGQRAIEIAPATAAGYRQLGRTYMLVGDMEHAASVLQDGLLVAVQPNDVAMAYYQLAYVLWKAGRPQAGAVCYLKSMMTSSSMVLQATAELQELIEETGVPLVAKEVVDEELANHAVPVAPTVEVLDALDAAAAAATDADLFPVARNLLALRLRYRPDDALVNVLRSLEER